ncbi:MAG TPA: phage major capsid protein [Acidimicrobiales bacterium]|nr:phage major capsid protein [Acidimicrobiales bacterium]
MATEFENRVDALTKEVTDLANELRDKADMPIDRVASIEEEITAKSAQIDSLLEEKRIKEVEARVNAIDDRLKAFGRSQASQKASAILSAVSSQPSVKSVGRYNEDNFLAAIVNQRKGDVDAQAFVKSVLGTSDATGQSIVPNNFVAALVTQIAAQNPYRDLFNVVQVGNGAAIDIPYETTAITAALLQGAYGSNKDVRDFAFGQATATLYQIAQIADIGNQLLRQSNGAAEAAARRRLAKSIGATEAQYINNGSGSSQPLGFFAAIGAYGDPAAFRTALSSEPRAAAIGRGISAMEARGIVADQANLCVVMHPTDFWELATEGLGTSYAGGWAIDPADGAAGSPPITSVWGVPIRRDPYWPAAKIGTALIIERSEVEIYVSDEFRIDVSDGGTRFDQNVTGFRGEEMFGFNAEPYVRTGRVQQVTGI